MWVCAHAHECVKKKERKKEGILNECLRRQEGICVLVDVRIFEVLFVYLCGYLY